MRLRISLLRPGLPTQIYRDGTGSFTILPFWPIIAGRTQVIFLIVHMLPRALTYSPIQEIDEDDSTTEKLLGHWLSPRVNHKISRFRSFWNHYWAYFTHGALLLVLIFFFCLWMRARVQILKFAVYCKSHFVKVQKQTTWNLSTAPANVAVEYYKELTVFNGTFNHPSVYRGYPTPEIDAAWRRISQDGEDYITLTLIHATDCQLSS